MTREIRLQQAPIEHATKQPPDKRYALFCDAVLGENGREICETQTKLGHIGDYGDYKSAIKDAISHQHPALIKFYPDYDTTTPSKDFLNDLAKKH